MSLLALSDAYTYIYTKKYKSLGKWDIRKIFKKYLKQFYQTTPSEVEK